MCVYKHAKSNSILQDTTYIYNNTTCIAKFVLSHVRWIYVKRGDSYINLEDPFNVIIHPNRRANLQVTLSVFFLSFFFE